MRIKRHKTTSPISLDLHWFGEYSIKLVVNNWFGTAVDDPPDESPATVGWQ